MSGMKDLLIDATDHLEAFATRYEVTLEPGQLDSLSMRLAQAVADASGDTPPVTINEGDRVRGDKGVFFAGYAATGVVQGFVTPESDSRLALVYLDDGGDTAWVPAAMLEKIGSNA